MTAVMDAPTSIGSLPFDWQNPDYNLIFNERIARLQRLRARPEILSGIKEYYKTNVVDFVRDWGSTYDPRNIEVGLPTLIPFYLFPRQEQFLLWLYERWQSREGGLVEKSRDMGVSWLCVSFAIWFWLFHAGAVVSFGSRKEEYVDDLNNPDCLFWKARKFIDTLPLEFRPDGWDVNKHAHYMKLTNPENESSILGEAGDNIGRGARASIYFVDEAAFLEHQDKVDAALSQTTNCKFDVSTPNGAGNAFYRKRHGGKIKVFVFDWRADPRKNQSWYDKQTGKLDPVIVASEIDRNYEASVANAFIAGDIVEQAMRRGPADIQPMGGLRVGVDPARFGPDQTAIIFRRGRVVLKIIRIPYSDAVQVASRVKMELAAFQHPPEQIAVDSIGFGGGVADLLRGWFPNYIVNRVTNKTQKVVVDVNASIRMKDGKHYNMRAFMWSQMKEWLQGAAIPNDPDLRVDLTALHYTFRAGEILLESKADAKARGVRSPDSGDALALTFAEPTIPLPQKLHVSPRLPVDAGLGALG